MTSHWVGTVANFWTTQPDLEVGQWLYVVRAHDAVLYVGKAVDVVRRLRQHLAPPGCINWGSSPVASLAQRRWEEEAQGWQVEVISVEGDLSAAEVTLIHELRPCLNTQNNARGRELPRRFQVSNAAELELEAARLAKFQQLRRSTKEIS